jgi:hypothetical protein
MTENDPQPIEALGVGEINARIDRLARERVLIEEEIAANERERDELYGKWDRNVNDHNRHVAKLRLLLGVPEREEEE